MGMGASYKDLTDIAQEAILRYFKIEVFDEPEKVGETVKVSLIDPNTFDKTTHFTVVYVDSKDKLFETTYRAVQELMQQIIQSVEKNNEEKKR